MQEITKGKPGSLAINDWSQSSFRDRKPMEGAAAADNNRPIAAVPQTLTSVIPMAGSRRNQSDARYKQIGQSRLSPFRRGAEAKGHSAVVDNHALVNVGVHEFVRANHSVEFHMPERTALVSC